MEMNLVQLFITHNPSNLFGNFPVCYRWAIAGFLLIDPECGHALT